jgi:hypothetical protein
MEVTLAIVGFVLSCVSIILAGIAYWRTGGRQDVMSLRDDVRREIGLVHERQRKLADETARWLRADYEETIARAQRARGRIALARKEAADEVKSRLEALDRRLTELGDEAQAWIARQQQQTDADLHAAQLRIARTERLLEGELQLIVLKSEMRKAERLTADRNFSDAETKLEGAVARVSNVETLIGDDPTDQRALEEVQHRLFAAIRGLRSNAATSREQLQNVVQASDTLLKSLEGRERKAA